MAGLLALSLLLGPALTSGVGAQPARAFERDLFKTRFRQEINFRAAAIQVAWAAERLCDSTTEIEPFVLWSTNSLRRRLSDADMTLFREVTGMDEKWRVVWMDEGAPDDLKLRDVVVAVNERKLPESGTRFEFSALMRGGAVVANDDQGFYDVVLQARAEAKQGKPMSITLADGRKLKVETQTGCAGSVTASGFDTDPSVFWRQGTQRAKIPANAMLEARSWDEFRWLAAFGTYFQASQSAIEKAKLSEGLSAGFTVGKILLLAVPGAGMMLSAAQAEAEKDLVVNSIVGNADLFANEVVVAMGGDAGAGLRLTERMLANAVTVDAVLMDEGRRATAGEHARRIKALQAAQLERERAELRAQEEAQRQPLTPR